MLRITNVLLHMLLPLLVLIGCKKENTDPGDEPSVDNCTIMKFNRNDSGTNYAKYEYNAEGKVIRENVIELTSEGEKIVDSTSFEYDIENRVNKVVIYKPEVIIKQNYTYSVNDVLSQISVKKEIIDGTKTSDSIVYEKASTRSINISQYSKVIQGGITYYDTAYYKKEFDEEGNVLRVFGKGLFYPKDDFVLACEVQYADRIPSNLKAIADAYNMMGLMIVVPEFLFGKTKMIKELKTYSYAGSTEPNNIETENYNYIYDSNGNLTGVDIAPNVFVYGCE